MNFLYFNWPQRWLRQERPLLFKNISKKHLKQYSSSVSYFACKENFSNPFFILSWALRWVVIRLIENEIHNLIRRVVILWKSEHHLRRLSHSHCSSMDVTEPENLLNMSRVNQIRCFFRSLLFKHLYFEFSNPSFWWLHLQDVSKFRFWVQLLKDSVSDRVMFS